MSNRGLARWYPVLLAGVVGSGALWFWYPPIDWLRTYTEVKGWQQSIGSIVGFGGLIAGALFNAHLNRLRDDQQRTHEALAVASALYAEILIQRRGLARLANAVGRRYVDHGFNGRGNDPFDKHFIASHSLPPPKIYPALLGEIGTLPGSLALEITQFYTLLEEAQIWLERMEYVEERGFTYSVNYVLNRAIDAIKGIAPSLREIERLAGITAVEDEPNIKPAVDAQGHEDWMNEQSSFD